MSTVDLSVTIGSCFFCVGSFVIVCIYLQEIEKMIGCDITLSIIYNAIYDILTMLNSLLF